jgi:hypothetical protein
VLQDLGTAEPSMLSDLLQSNLSASESKLDEIKWTTASVFSGGAETVRISPKGLKIMYH